MVVVEENAASTESYFDSCSKSCNDLDEWIRDFIPLHSNRVCSKGSIVLEEEMATMGLLLLSH